MNSNHIHANSCAFCVEPQVGARGGVRLCQHHLDLVDAIVTDAGVDDVSLAPRGRRPRVRRVANG